MNRTNAVNFCRAELDKHGLSDWHIKITVDPNAPFLGLCDYAKHQIILNGHHIDIHPDAEVINTIRHEVAHAIMPGHGHDDEWARKAREIGCDNTLPCSHLNIPAHVIDAIRSGANIEMTVEETVHVIRKPTFKVTRLQDSCPICGKVAKEKTSITTIDKQTGDQIKWITLECFHLIKKIIPKATPFEDIVSNDWKPEVKNCKHEWVKNQCTNCGEFKLYPFQVTGARFLEVSLSIQRGAAICDDMGLGKTMQFLAFFKYWHKTYAPCLIVTKSAIKYQWLKNILKWLGMEFMAQIISTSRDLILPGLKLYIIPYDLLRRFNHEELVAAGFKLIVLDECQQIKNVDSARTQEVRKLVKALGCKVVPLSATPWKNKGSEFFPMLNLIDPIKFYNYQKYLDNWVEYYWHGNKRKMGGIKRPEKFREFTSELLIRREYTEVMEEFPETNRMKLNIALDSMYQNQYNDAEDQFVKWYNNEGEDKGGIAIQGQLMRLRHLTGLAKIPATLEFIEEFVEETDKKLVVFVHHKDVGEYLYQYLTDTNKTSDYHELAQTIKDEGIIVLRGTAEGGDEKKFDIQQKFNGPGRCILIASTLAYGEGIDLQTCSDCVMHERQWNPQNEEQAAPGRFRRIGQTASVINVTYAQAEDTVDEHLDELVEAKRRAFHRVMNKTQLQNWDNDELMAALAHKIVDRYNRRKSLKRSA